MEFRAGLAVGAASFGVLTVLAGTAVAGPLDRRTVPADSRWVVHVDVEAVAASKVGAAVRDKNPEKHAEGLRKLREELHLDPFKDILGVTIFGKTENEDDAVIVLTGTEAVEQAVLGQMAGNPDVAKITEQGYTIVTWKEGDESHHAHVRNGPVQGQRVLVIANGLDALVDAVRSIDGKSPTLASPNAGPLDPKPSPGSFVYVDVPEVGKFIAGEVGEKQAGNPNDPAALISKIGGMRIDIGESAENIFITADLATDTAQTASDMMQSVMGLMAMARLVSGEDEQLREAVQLLQTVRVSTAASTLKLRADLPMAKVVKLIEEAEAGAMLTDDEDADEEGDAKAKAPAKSVEPAAKPGEKGTKKSKQPG